MPTTKLTDDNFEAHVLNASGTVLVDFWGSHCAPCKKMAPSLEAMSDQFQGDLMIAKLNIEENPMTPSRYGIRAVPTLMIFQNGKQKETRIGAQSKDALSSWLKEVVATNCDG